MDEKKLQFLGLAATIVGVGASLLSSIIGKEQQTLAIEKEVKKALQAKK